MKEKSDNVARWVAWKLPKKVVYYVLIRALAYATTGKYSNIIVPELTADEMIRKWEKIS